MFEKPVEKEKANSLMARYMETFIKPSYKPWNERYNCLELPWIYYKVDTKVLDWFIPENINSIDLPFDRVVYCHNEREKIVYETTYREVYNLLMSLEPWDEIDVELFDDSFSWTVAFTHEMEAILFGVDLKLWEGT
ncbi:MAG: hypothetical protein LBR21_10075 [Propionibacteriaceae bacterium]|jgi:hypothetical protein|nr:hypothetical protein [Propionibacteriaceae bacterium]